MLSINTNISSLITQRSMKSATNLLNQAVERMSTGYKVNHAKDNAANYSISTNMTTQINSYMVAEDNAMQALDMVSTAEGTLDQIHEKLERLRALQEQASNGTYSLESREAINAEVNALTDEISRLYSTAEYNGVKLFGDVNLTSGSRSGSAPAPTTFKKTVTNRSLTGMTPLESISDTTPISNGTYYISTKEDLLKFAKMVNNGSITGGEFVLANNIDMSGVNWTPIGIRGNSGSDYAFKGTFDGNGCIISNLTINKEILSYEDTASFFNVTENATIKNLGLANVDFKLVDPATNVDDVSDIVPSGLISTMNGGTLENCFISGNIELVGGMVSSGAGTLVGATFYNGVTIKDSVSNVDFTLKVDACTHIGGLVGFAGISTDITNCSYNGNIKFINNYLPADQGRVYMGGGLVGYGVDVTISDSTVQGSVSYACRENAAFSTLAAYLTGASSIKNCYYDSTIDSPAGVYYQVAGEVTNIRPFEISTKGFITQITQRNTDGLQKFSEVNTSSTISSGSYSISTSAELAQLATMANNGLITGGEFVLANDIDLSSYSNWTPIGNGTNMFAGTFDGNGYAITGLNSTGFDYAGLFGGANNAIIKNLGVENGYADGNLCAGLIVAGGNSITVENCYATGASSSTKYCGGLVGLVVGKGDIQNSWSNTEVFGDEYAGGLVGATLFGSVNINNTFAKGNITSTGCASGLVGMQAQFDPDGSACGMVTKITNSFFDGQLSVIGTNSGITYCDSGNIFADSVAGCYYNSEKNYFAEALNCRSGYTNNAPASAVVGKTTAELQAMLPTLYDYPSGLNDKPDGSSSSPSLSPASIKTISFQIGINSSSSSQIELNIDFEIGDLSELRKIGLENQNKIDTIDSILSKVSAKQTELGSTSNRLMSVIDEISIKYENLVSSRSTIRDADIAEVSSQYIQQQILQQASATLMATANQMPAIALQLI